MKFSEAAKRTSDVIISWLTVVGILLGGTWTLKEYSDTQRAARVSRTFEYVKRANEGDVLKANRDMNVMTREIRSLAQSLPTETRAKAISEMQIKRYAEDQAYRLTFSALEGFYSELAICTSRELCDKESADSFFRRNAFAFYMTQSSVFCLLRTEQAINRPAGPIIDAFVRDRRFNDPCELDRPKLVEFLRTIE
jgi:hypothetical protein